MVSNNLTDVYQNEDMGQIVIHNLTYIPQNSFTMIGYFLEVFNFNQLFLKLTESSRTTIFCLISVGYPSELHGAIISNRHYRF